MSKLDEWIVSLIVIDEIRPENQPVEPKVVILGSEKNEAYFEVMKYKFIITGTRRTFTDVIGNLNKLYTL